MRLVFNVKFFYYVWVLANFIALFLSGYVQRVSEAFLKMNWSEFVKVNLQFYPFGETTIHDYDLTEFMVYLIVPVILFRIIYNIFGR